LENIVEIDPWMRSSESGLSGFYGIRKLANGLVGQPQQFIDLLSQSEFRVLEVKSDQQSGVIEEIALLLSKTIFIINQLLDAGVPLGTIVSHIQITLEIRSGYLFEICRLRCLRYLFHQVVVALGLTDFEAGSLKIQAITTGIQSGGNSISENSHHNTKDQNRILISNTTQSMSAILGGCDILTIIPHLNGFNCLENAPRRIARNIGHILREESNLHKVADPVAGAYYMESLTTNISRAVWSRLQELESEGGYLTHVNGTI
jgi:methylmalonyl-CoA mutase